MGAFQNIGLMSYFKRYGLKYGIKRGIFNVFPFHIVNDYENKKLLYYKKVEKILKRKYLKAINKEPQGLEFKKKSVDNPIWIYWKQGIENAPDIVKLCAESVIRYTNQEVIFLSDKNVSEYVIFPEYIQKKLKSGNMSYAAFSDLLRFSLIEHFGGTWIDATVLLTDKLPDYIIESDFFAYQNRYGKIENPALICNWFLHCKQHNKILLYTRNMTFEYWRNENSVIEYLFTYIFLKISIEILPEIKKNILYANSDCCELLFDELSNTFDKHKYEHIIKLSCVHKLSYKLKDSVYNNIDNFYNHIIKQELE